jgi:branched-chain amino acid aminotransferase
MVKPTPNLQQPKWVYFNGQIRPWEEAVFHVSSEAVVRGLNVFEGIKGFWQKDGRFALLAMARHWRRLKRSAALLHMPFSMSYEEWLEAHQSLIARLCTPSQNMWIRATLYMVEGHWGVGDRTDLVLTAFYCPLGMPPAFATGVSTWQRATDLSLSPRIKTGDNYQVARLAKIEGRNRGYSEMVLLNAHGRVAESIGSAVLIVRDGAVITPPHSEGAFESITADIVEQLCLSLKIPFLRRPVDRTELLIADEMAYASTLNDVVLISSIDEKPFGKAPILTAIAERYYKAVMGEAPHPSVELSYNKELIRGARVAASVPAT